ncbi:MAG: NAD(P)-specific glutamate dehydrogenase [Pseudomonadota bacterium]
MYTSCLRFKQQNMFNANEFLNQIAIHNPNENEFQQAVYELVYSLGDFLNDNNKYIKHNILERICEPERVIMFRVPWVDDKGNVQVNRGYRVQMNSAIGPYKGGLRFHSSVNLSIMKFLAFEQVFKNALTTLPMGGGKGGSNFDPKGKSDNEVMKFCQSFMNELYRHIGHDTDVPAGDIGVGAREVGYLFGQYKKLANEFNGVFTGKGINYGGSLIRPEATGYGCVIFVNEMLKRRNTDLKGKTVVISGSGNVAQYACEHVNNFGGKVIAMSDSDGFIYDKDGINAEKLAFIMHLKNEKRGRIAEYADKFNAEYVAEKKPWGLKCDVAIPCATQNEIDENDAKILVANGCICVAEGANMPVDLSGLKVLQENKILYAPGKASNAGGVATSGLEMTQNSMRLSWTRNEVYAQLEKIMINIHNQCVQHGGDVDYVDYVKGANVAGFIKVADAMISQGVV